MFSMIHIVNMLGSFFPSCLAVLFQFFVMPNHFLILSNVFHTHYLILLIAGIFAAINDYNAENSKDADVVDVISTWDKPIEVVKEPDACSALRNLLFSFPGRGFVYFV